MKIKTILLSQLSEANNEFYSETISVGSTLDNRIIAKIEMEDNTAKLYDIDNDLIASLFTVKGFIAFK